MTIALRFLRGWDHSLLTVILAVLAVGLAACGDDGARVATAAVDERPTTTTTPAVRPTQLVDADIEIDGGRMHLRCIGEGPTTVLLLAGWGSSGDGWGAIEPPIAERARVCSYSKFGTGTSDAPSTAQTFSSQAADLHHLLDEAGEPGPYVVLGHSFGGAQAVTFASEHPEEVVGLMLLDASPPTWPAAVCAVPDDGTDAARDAGGLCATMHDPALDPERIDVVPAFEEVAAIESLGDLPTTVMSGARRSWPGLAEDQITRLTQVWNEGVDRWAGLSTTSTTVFVQDTSHLIQLDQPDLVVDHVLALLPAGE